MNTATIRPGTVLTLRSCKLATYKLVAFNPATGDVQAFETMALRADDAIADVEGMFGVQVRECWKVGV